MLQNAASVCDCVLYEVPFFPGFNFHISSSSHFECNHTLSRRFAVIQDSSFGPQNQNLKNPLNFWSFFVSWAKFLIYITFF